MLVVETDRDDPSGVFAQKKPIKAICREFRYRGRSCAR